MPSPDQAPEARADTLATSDRAHLLLCLQAVRRGLDSPRLLPARVRPHEGGDAQGARVAETPHEHAVLALGRLPRVLEHRSSLLSLPQLAGARRPCRHAQAPVEHPPHRPRHHTPQTAAILALPHTRARAASPPLCACASLKGATPDSGRVRTRPGPELRLNLQPDLENSSRLKLKSKPTPRSKGKHVPKAQYGLTHRPKQRSKLKLRPKPTRRPRATPKPNGCRTQTQHSGDRAGCGGNEMQPSHHSPCEKQACLNTEPTLSPRGSQEATFQVETAVLSFPPAKFPHGQHLLKETLPGGRPFLLPCPHCSPGSIKCLLY